jgi:hypothetical protein
MLSDTMHQAVPGQAPTDLGRSQAQPAQPGPTQANPTQVPVPRISLGKRLATKGPNHMFTHHRVSLDTRLAIKGPSPTSTHQGTSQRPLAAKLAQRLTLVQDCRLAAQRKPRLPMQGPVLARMPAIVIIKAGPIPDREPGSQPSTGPTLTLTNKPQLATSVADEPGLT